MRVLVVDDSALMCRALTQMIASDPTLEVVGIAHNGAEAIEKAKLLRPDVITLDIEMPVLGGLDALRRIRAECEDPKPAVLICSNLTSVGSHDALAALRAGAADVIAKDGSQFNLNVQVMRDELIAKVKAVGATRARRAVAPPMGAHKAHTLRSTDVDLVLIGSSTGGPPALEKILTGLPSDLPVPIVVAQHMPAMFTRSLAERLDTLCALTVVHAEHGMFLTPGNVYIGVGGKHVRIVRSAPGRYGVEISDQPADALYKPSVNELFASGARSAGPRCVGIVLTGMGDDGKLGAIEIHSKLGVVLTQDMESCVVYGMPRAANEAGVALASLPPEQLAAVISTLAPSGAHGAHGVCPPRAA